MHDTSVFFFFFFFLNHLTLTFSSFFLRDTDLRKGTMCPFCVPIHKKKKITMNFDVFLYFQVIDVPERLRDTLIHEMCHAAAWIISGYKDGHGRLWKAW